MIYIFNVKYDYGQRVYMVCARSEERARAILTLQAYDIERGTVKLVEEIQPFNPFAYPEGRCSELGGYEE